MWGVGGREEMEWEFREKGSAVWGVAEQRSFWKDLGVCTIPHSTFSFMHHTIHKDSSLALLERCRSSLALLEGCRANEDLVASELRVGDARLERERG